MKRNLACLVASTALLSPSFVSAQHDHDTQRHGSDSSAGHSQGPYAGMQSRAIKALSEQQVADLRAGKGISLALAAELNGYPGPSHSLELADQLNLSTEQKVRTRTLFEKMQQEAKAAGEEVIAAEARRFIEPCCTPPVVLYQIRSDEAPGMASRLFGSDRHLGDQTRCAAEQGAEGSTTPTHRLCLPLPRRTACSRNRAAAAADEEPCQLG